MPQSRFVDSGRWLRPFAGEFLVRCPRCPATATVRRDLDREARWWEPAAVTCGGCGFARRQDRRAGCECGQRGQRAGPDRYGSAYAGTAAPAAARSGCGAWNACCRRVRAC
ncbi:hypothetical protein [Actinoplanes campanulatus]|uniref:hypothetical protein n=1 Tax=Actinoplanes campanulatus TaxID=113559 RepID=UPI0031DC1A04